MKTFNQFLKERVATGPRLGEPREKGATHANAGEGEKIQKRTKKWMEKKGQKGAPGLDAMKAREAEHRAKRGVKEEVVDEGILTSISRKKSEKKAEKAMDAGARARRKVARRVHAKYVSGSEDLVPDDIREGLIDAVKKGAKRHSKAVEKKKIKNRKAVPYAALAAQHEPEGEVVNEKVVDEGIRRAIKKGVKIAKRVVKDAGPYDPGGYTSIGSLGNPHLGNEEKRKKERAAKRGVKEEVVDETYFDSNTRGVSTKGGLTRQYNKPGKLSQSSFSHERKSKKPELRMSKKELRKSMVDDATYEKKMGRSKPTPSNLKTSLKKMRKEDKAFDFVKAKIEKEVGKSGYVSKDNPRKPQSAADKAKARAHQAKVDKENAAERAKDPSQGRYSRSY